MKIAFLSQLWVDFSVLTIEFQSHEDDNDDVSDDDHNDGGYDNDDGGADNENIW